MTTKETNAARSKPARRVVAEAHAFTSGQSVRLKNAYLSSGNVYIITASLPTSGASPQYRIRNEKENFERMAGEADLELLGSSPPEKEESAVQLVFGADRAV